MPLAAKISDKGSQHDDYRETVINTGSGSVFIDGLPAARKGDPLTPHAKPKHPPHPRKIASGSGTVFIEGLPAARTGDAVNCGGVIIGGTVTIG
ncbi:type VI secretion system PAAR protein [Yokenella regensburgei]|uniref:type VI secretion system PAAR protein n=1 Tax=Yokenella regensburgei TaxID=158877 RepID=UPI003F15923F